MKILIIMATHNRRVKTIACIDAANAAALSAGVTIEFLVVDAASSDGTREALESAYVNLRCETAPASSYWASSMRRAWEIGSQTEFDILLWLNDDVILFESAFLTLLKADEQFNGGRVIIGACTDSTRLVVTYSGLRSASKWNRMKLSPIAPGEDAAQCDTFNGNVVLVPKRICEAVSGFPSGYTHSMADLAFGFELTRRGTPGVLAQGFVGECERNGSAGTWHDQSLPASRRAELLRSPKGLPFKEWATLCATYGGRFHTLIAVKPYLLVYGDVLKERVLTTVKTIMQRNRLADKSDTGSKSSSRSTLEI